jgi:hypothetical protein
MSSVLTSFKVDDNKRVRRRSESVSGIKKVKEKRRLPAVNLDDEIDVATLVCTEISRAIMLAPDLNLGTFFKTSSNSRRDINISDATLIISTAILAHIGNKRMSDRLLNKSATVNEYYTKMGLKDPIVREMMVTMLFALTPAFAKMVETSIRLSLDRSALETTHPKADSDVSKALIAIGDEGLLKNTELEIIASEPSGRASSVYMRDRRDSIQRTPTELITPDDSASVITSVKREITGEKDIMSYINRKKRGVIMKFEEQFPLARRPTVVNFNNNKAGIGYKQEVKTDRRTSDSWAKEMNNILGSQTILSIDHNTGKESRRRPRVEDYLDSEPVAASVLNSPPDVRSTVEHNYSFDKVDFPSYVKTESYLPRSVVGSELSNNKNVQVKDSLEELQAKFRQASLAY